MDIAALSMVNSQQQVQSQAGIMILKKAMDSSKQDASAIMQMMGVGANVDIKI